MIQLARNPSVLRHGSIRLYGDSPKDSLSASHLAMVVANAYSERSSPLNVESIHEWSKLRNWLFDVEQAIAGSAQNTTPERLWARFLRKRLFARIKECLTVDTAKACVQWAQLWTRRGLMTRDNLSVFFMNVAKPFLVDHLQELCESRQVHDWVDLTSECDLSQYLGIIVREHAENELQIASVPGSKALALV